MGGGSHQGGILGSSAAAPRDRLKPIYEAVGAICVDNSPNQGRNGGNGKEPRGPHMVSQ